MPGSLPGTQRHARFQVTSPGSCGHSTRAAVWAHPGGGSQSRGLLSPWTGNTKVVLPQQGATRAAPHPHKPACLGPRQPGKQGHRVSAGSSAWEGVQGWGARESQALPDQLSAMWVSGGG